MKKILNLVVALGITLNSYAATAGTVSLNSIILEQEYAQSSRVLTAEAKKELQNKFDSKVKAYLTGKSDAQILSEVTELVEEMPESAEKKSFKNIIAENSATPAEAIKEIAESKSFGLLKSGDSANWSVGNNMNFLMALAGVIIIAAVLVFNRKASEGKKNDLNPNDANKPQDGVVTFHGSDSETRECWKVRDNTSGMEKEECESCGSSPAYDAEDEALIRCYNAPGMNVAACNAGTMTSSVSGSGTSCYGSATLTYILR